MTTRRTLKLIGLEIAALVLASAIGAARAATPAMAAAAADEPAGAMVVGTVGKESISYAQLLARSREALATQQQQQEEARLRLVEQGARERHAALAEQLDKLLDERALAAEAAVQKTTSEALLAAITPEAVGDAQVQEFYESRKGPGDPAWAVAEPQIGGRIREILATDHVEQAQRRYLDGLRSLHGISGELPPYRVVLPAGNLVRGKATAPVTLVEFGDFQCPSCLQAEPIVASLLAQHPDELRLVFHHFPLARVHPNARSAAFAGECARQQGKFWEMHDAMFADQSALAPAQLQVTAGRIGLEGAAFAKCLADPATVRVVDAELRLGASVGVNGTPTFYVNGRPVSGDRAALAIAISEELARKR
jgi:protein-disulfide isomerase